ncbi:MAG: MlaD family protein, partial [Stellaceae bacterium]
PSPPGSKFRLYASEKDADEAAEPVRVSYQLEFPGSVSGITAGTPVNLRGLPIGEVTAVRLEYDPAADTIREPVTIEVAPHRIKVGGRSLDTMSADPVAATNRMFEQLVAKGLRAQLVTANLLTGQRAIELDFVTGAPPAKVAGVGLDPQLPTVESTDIAQVTRSANKLMSKLAALPLDQLVGQIRLMVGHADRLIDRPEVKRSLHNLDLTLANTARLTRTADIQVGPLLQRLNGAAGQLRATLMILGNDPAASNDLARTLAELKDAARSIRVLADYLERHPESLISGKPSEASR